MKRFNNFNVLEEQKRDWMLIDMDILPKKIILNNKTKKTVLLHEVGTRLEATTVVSEKGEFVNFEFGFVLAIIKRMEKRNFQVMVKSYWEKPEHVGFFHGYALRLFHEEGYSVRSFERILKAIKNKDTSVSVHGKTIEIEYIAARKTKAKKSKIN